MIDEADGTYLYDVQLEYAYLYQFGKGEIDAFRMPDDGGASTAASAITSRNKRQAPPRCGGASFKRDLQ